MHASHQRKPILTPYDSHHVIIQCCLVVRERCQIKVGSKLDVELCSLEVSFKFIMATSGWDDGFRFPAAVDGGNAAESRAVPSSSGLEADAAWLVSQKGSCIFPATVGDSCSGGGGRPVPREGKQRWQYPCSLSEPTLPKPATIPVQDLPRIRVHQGCIVQGKVVGFAAPSSILIAVDAVVDWNGLRIT
jgi:hypothetical protein